MNFQLSSWFLHARSILAAGLFTFLPLGAHGLTIDLNYDPQMEGTAELAGFQDAAGFWESTFTDNVTVTIDVGFSAISQLAESSTTQTIFAYQGIDVSALDPNANTLDNIFGALTSDQTSLADSIAVANLQTDQALDLLIQDVNGNVFLDGNLSDSGDSQRWFTDNGANNLILQITTANAKALGLQNDLNDSPLTDFLSDGNITLDSGRNWDFDASNGIDSDATDFVAVALHEMAHVLGFVSGVDTVDSYIAGDPLNLVPDACNQTLDNCSVIKTLDLFRFSGESAALGNVIDLTVGSSYFSIDGGVTNLAGFSEGLFFSGDQASHWLDDNNNAGETLGRLDPRLSLGELSPVTDLDLLALDVIGWDLAQVAVPEPSSLVLLMIGLLALLFSRRGRLMRS